MYHPVAWRLFCVAVAIATAAMQWSGCSSDPNTPLGESFVPDSLIPSRPGRVVQDTLVVISGDTTFSVNAYQASLLTASGRMLFGRDDDFRSTMLFRFDFSKAGADTLKTVTKAQLTLSADPTTQAGSLGALFYEMNVPFTTSDTLTSLSLGVMPIPDSTLTNVDRSMAVFPRTYTLPPALVQAWIRGDSIHNGIAIVLNDTTTTREMTFANRTNAVAPFLKVFFSNATETSYRLIADGTFVEDLSSTTELRVSDGDIKRTFLPVRLAGLPKDIMLNQAKLVMRVVPNSVSNFAGTLELYAPGDSVVGSSGILTGTAVTSAAIGQSGVVEFPIRNIVSRFLADPTGNHGFVIRYLPESNGLERVDFFSSAAADSVKPRLLFTYTTPATFPDI
jgi:hypothetical protein